MIPVIGGWKSVRGVDEITLIPPEGAEHGRIVYRERQRPVLRLELLLGAELGELARRARVVSLVTAEGEHAVHATAIDDRVRHDVGLVFVDDFYACVRGTCHERAGHEAFGATVRALVVADSHAMTQRRRRFLYTPPPGWHGLARGLETHWFPIDYPRNASTISVPPANPGAIDPALIARNRLELDIGVGFTTMDVRSPEPISSPGLGLEGVSFSVTGFFGDELPFVREIAVLTDTRFTYSMLFDAAGPLEDRLATRRVFRELVRSIQPLPARSRDVPVDVVNQWSE